MPTDRYHHGNLRPALVDASVELARQGGPAAVVLREAARAVGVSHNAAYRHFANREELLAAVADYGLSLLAASMETSLAEVELCGDPVLDAWSRLMAVGRGYVRFALAEPGLFRTAFGVVGDPRQEPHRPEAMSPLGTDAFVMLQSCLDELVAVGAVAPERRANSELVAWSCVHGLSSLALDGPLRHMPRPMIDDVYQRVCEVIIGGL